MMRFNAGQSPATEMKMREHIRNVSRTLNHWVPPCPTPQSDLLMLDRQLSHFKWKLSTLFMSLYDRPSSSASLPKWLCQRFTGRWGRGGLPFWNRPYAPASVLSAPILHQGMGDTQGARGPPRYTASGKKAHHALWFVWHFCEKTRRLVFWDSSTLNELTSHMS